MQVVVLLPLLLLLGCCCCTSNEYFVNVISDKELFEALDLSLPALSQVKEYYAEGNIKAAKQALAKYYRERKNYGYWNVYFDGMCSGGLDWIPADDIVNGRIRIVNLDHKFPNGSDIDWFTNPTYNNPNMAYDPEWQWQLGRMCFWRTLSDAYAQTKKEIYAQTLIAQMRSFAAQCPAPVKSNNTAWSSWRTLDSGIRAGDTWPNAWVSIISSPSLGDDDLILWVKVFYDHAKYLYKYHMSAGNWVTMEMNGLYGVGVLFQEFTNSSVWRKFATQYVYDLCKTAILPDGAWYELTLSYMQDAINNIAWPYKVALMYNTTSDFPDGYKDMLHVSYLFNVYAATPDATFPLVNDAWLINATSQAAIGLSLFPTDPTLAWAASGGKTGNGPAQTSFYFKDSGYIAMRTGWSPQDTYAFFDVAPLGSGHYHQDKLNLLIDAYGRRMLYDNGGGNYETSKWRTYSEDTPSHNTVIVDGQYQRRTVTPSDNMGRGNPNTPVPIWNSLSDQDYGCGYYIDNYGTAPIASHRREVLFIKSPMQAFVVVDTLTPNDNKPHTYKALWNVLSNKFCSFDKFNLVSTNDENLPNLAIIALGANTKYAPYIAVNTSTEILGWDIERAPPYQIPALEVVHTIEASGVQQFVTLLLPIHPNASHNIASITSNSPKDYTIDFSTHKLEIVLGNDIGIKAIVV